MKRIRVGVVGLGGHLYDHLAPARQLGFELVAVCDPHRENALRVAATLGLDPTQVEFYSELGAFVQSVEVDVILVGSPDMFHAEQLLAIVKGLVARGLRMPVMVEKPLAITPADLEKVSKAFLIAVAHNIVVTSCHIRRFDSPYKWVSENLPVLVAEHGALRYIELDFKYPRPKEGDWKAVTRKLLEDHAPHEVHALLWWLGIEPFHIVCHENTPFRYLAEGWHGQGESRVTFRFSGSREADRAIEGRSPYPETIGLRFGDGHTHVIRTHAEAVVQIPDATSVLIPTDYDQRLLGVMGNIADVLDGGPSYLDMGMLLLVAEAVVALSAPMGEYSYPSGA